MTGRSPGRTARALLVAAMAAGLALGPMAQPAAAHASDGGGATNFLTTLEDVSPDRDGVSIRVLEKGSRIELTNRTETDAVVLGYEGEPYLRVGPDGVFENVRSPATYLNSSRSGGEEVPAEADADAEPEWVRVDDGPTARWHDHRIHWMGTLDPPQVRADRSRAHVITDDWRVPVRYGSTTIEARGRLVWVPGPSPALPLALAAIAAVALALSGRSRRWRSILAGLGLTLVAVDVVHVLGIAWAVEGTTVDRIGSIFANNLYAVLGWAAGLVGAGALLRGKHDGLFAVAFCSGLVAIFGGVVDIVDLSRSQIPFAWGDGPGRALVAVSLGLGLGTLAACVVADRTHRVPPPATDGPAPAGAG